MTVDAGKEKANRAKRHHKNGEYEQAADLYTEAAFEYTGRDGLEHSIAMADGLRYLVLSAACLRLADMDSQSKHRCAIGARISEAVSERAMELPKEGNSYDQSVRGVWFEFEADFKTVGNLPGIEDALSRAEEFYLESGDPETSSFEQYHMIASAFTKMAYRGTQTETDELDEVLSYPSTLTDWIDFKRRRMPELLDKLDHQKEWTYVF